MAWPLNQDYNEAIQDPRSCLSDPELRDGEAVCNALGLPRPRSGNFADFKIWDFQTRQLLHHPGGFRNYCDYLYFWADGKVLFGLFPYGLLVCWDVATGKELARGQFPAEMQLTSLRVNPSWTTVAYTVKGKPTIYLADIRGQGASDPVAVKPPDPAVNPPDNPNLPVVQQPGMRRLFTATAADPGAIAFARDGRTLFVAYIDSVLVLDTATGKERQPPIRAHANIPHLALSHDGKVLVTAGNLDRTVKLWNADTGTLLRTLEGPTANVMRVAVSATGNTVVSGGDSTLRVWNAGTGKKSHTLALASKNPRPMAMDLDGRWVAVTRTNNTSIELVSPITGQWKEKRLTTGLSPSALAFRPPSSMVLAVCYHSGLVQLWDVGGGGPRWSLEGTKQAYCLAFSPDGGILAVGGATGSVRLINSNTGREIRVLEGTGNNLFFLAFSPDGKTLAGSGGGLAVVLWDVFPGAGPKP